MASRVLLFCALLYLVAADGDVIELTDDTFNDEVKKHDIILVEFFAPWSVALHVALYPIQTCL